MLLVTIGPVQEFIAQARRTRDLWYGSHLLSELSRAAARELVALGAELIFPALESGDAELAPCLESLRSDTISPLNIANKLISSVPSEIDPEQLARATREAVKSFWSRIASDVFIRCRSLLAPRTEAVWNEQVESFVEFAASWVPLDGEYTDARRKLEQAIAGRKNLRDFAPWTELRGGVHKSSLDGGRETVLLPNAERPRSVAAKYRIVNTEQLDAIGLIKRAGGKPDQFIPIVNVAAASWLAKAKSEAPRQLEALIDACQVVGLSRVDRRDLPCARDFPVDASILFRNRWKSVFTEQDRSNGNDTPTSFDFNSWGEKNVLPLLNALAEPP